MTLHYFNSLIQHWIDITESFYWPSVHSSPFWLTVWSSHILSVLRLLMLSGGSSHNLCTESYEYVQIGKVVVSHLHRCFQISLGELVSWISSVFCDEYVKGEHIRQAQHAPFARFSSVWSSYTPFELFCISHYYKFNLSFLSSLDACLVLPLI